MGKKKIIIITLMIVCGIYLYYTKLNYQIKLDYREIESIRVENDNPPFNNYYMDASDVELFVKYFNEAKLEKCESNIVDELVGEGKKITIYQKKGEFILYSLESYFEIDSIWYKCASDSNIYKIIRKY